MNLLLKLVIPFASASDGADNRRAYQSKWLNAGTGATQEVLTFWSGGKRAGRFELVWSGTTAFALRTLETNVYFGGKPLRLAHSF